MPKHSIFLDNAGTTETCPEVSEALDHALGVYGNPASTHEYGRKAKGMLEKSRRAIAQQFGVATSEILFTSGATESIYQVILSSILDLGITHFISSRMEHAAVIEALLRFEKKMNISVSFVKNDHKGRIDLEDLERLLTQNKTNEAKTMICLMYANNEIGNINPVADIGKLAHAHGALYFCDTVQAVGKYEFAPHEMNIDLCIGTAHKLCGPKGVGFLMRKKSLQLLQLQTGGGQEYGCRAGTQNMPLVVALSTAIQTAYGQLEKNYANATSLKQHLIDRLNNSPISVAYNGLSGDMKQSSPYILNIAVPCEGEKGLLPFKLDMKGIAVSSGSACSSGSNKPSHVIQALAHSDEKNKENIRASFSRTNTIAEIDAFVNTLVPLVSHSLVN